MDREFTPTRSDYVVRLFSHLAQDNPLLLIVTYTGLAWGGTILFAYLHGSAVPTDNNYLELFEDFPNLINFAIIVPVGVFLVLHFYRKVELGFRQIVADGIILFDSESAAASRFLQDLDSAVNRRWFFWLSLGVALAFNATYLFRKEDAWNDLGGGLPSWWFRLFSTLNYYMMCNIGLKGFVIVARMRRLFEHRVVLQPLHPDGCGGLRALGGISLALNYFVSLVAAYISVLAFVTRTPVAHPLFVPIVLAYFGIACYFFFVPLARAHDLMEREKNLILSALNKEFQQSYNRISSELSRHGISLADAQKIEVLERLYRIASRMPVWPMDTRIVVQFLGTVALPLLVGVTVAFVNAFFS